jgi:hypothetical protein
VVDAPGGGEDSRRGLLRGSLAAGLAVVGAVGVAGCGSTHAAKPDHHLLPARARRHDVKLLNEALALEQRTIAAYTAAGPLLSRQGQKVAGWFLGQELLHAGQVRSLITQLAGTSHNPLNHYDFGQAPGRRQLLELLYSLEQEQIAKYLSITPLLSSGFVRQGVAAVVANDAQHVYVLRAQLGRPALPGPLLTASE